jgi:hypothetical protein
MRQRDRRLASLLVTLAALTPRAATAQGDAALSGWEPATITQLEGARADTESGRSGTSLLTPDALQGPPTPATMYAIASLDADQLNRFLAALVERLWTQVAAQDRSFDEVVNTMLRKDQRRRYQEWKGRLARGAAEQGRLEHALSPG